MLYVGRAIYEKQQLKKSAKISVKIERLPPLLYVVSFPVPLQVLLQFVLSVQQTAFLLVALQVYCFHVLPLLYAAFLQSETN